MPISSQQGENFLAKQVDYNAITFLLENLIELKLKWFFQAALLQTCEQDAENPTELQEQITTILRGVPDLAEAVRFQHCVPHTRVKLLNIMITTETSLSIPIRRKIILEVETDP
jgi:hypothetical protein